MTQHPDSGCRYASANKCDVYHVTAANAIRTAGPAIQPMVEIAHGSDKTPEPITVVMMCAVIVMEVPEHSADLVRIQGPHHFKPQVSVCNVVILTGVCLLLLLKIRMSVLDDPIKIEVSLRVQDNPTKPKRRTELEVDVHKHTVSDDCRCCSSDIVFEPAAAVPLSP